MGKQADWACSCMQIHERAAKKPAHHGPVPTGHRVCATLLRYMGRLDITARQANAPLHCPVHESRDWCTLPGSPGRSRTARLAH